MMVVLNNKGVCKVCCVVVCALRYLTTYKCNDMKLMKEGQPDPMGDKCNWIHRERKNLVSKRDTDDYARSMWPTGPALVASCALGNFEVGSV